MLIVRAETLRLEILRFGESGKAEGEKGKGVGGDVECRAQ